MLSDKELLVLLLRTIAEKKLKRRSVAADLDVKPETVSRWKRTEAISNESRDRIAVWLAAHGVDIAKEEDKLRADLSEPSDGIFSELTQIWPKLAQSEKARVLAYASELLEKSGYAVHSQFLDKNERKACS